MTLFIETLTRLLCHMSPIKITMQNLYASIAKNVKNQQLFMDLYVGIVMDGSRKWCLQQHRLKGC